MSDDVKQKFKQKNHK